MREGTVVKKTETGQIYFCPGCNIFHMEFGNISMKFDIKGLIAFREAVSGIDVKYWEKVNKHSFYRRKIHVNTGQGAISFIFSSKEFFELKRLLNVNLDKFFRILYSRKKIIFN